MNWSLAVSVVIELGLMMTRQSADRCSAELHRVGLEGRQVRPVREAYRGGHPAGQASSRRIPAASVVIWPSPYLERGRELPLP